MAIFTEVMLAERESAFPILTSAQPGKLALPLKKVGQWRKSTISQVLTRVERANQTWLRTPGLEGPAYQFYSMSPVTTSSASLNIRVPTLSCSMFRIQ